MPARVVRGDPQEHDEAGADSGDDGVTDDDGALRGTLDDRSHERILATVKLECESADTPDVEAAPHPWPALGVLLLRDGLVEKAELEEILAEQRDSRERRVSGRRLGDVLIQRGRVTPQQVAKLVAEQYELPFVDFDVEDIDLRVASVLREDDARRFWAVPISRGGDGVVLLAIGDPATVLFSDELRRILGSVPRFAVVGPDAIERAITYVYSQPPPSISVVPETSEGANDLIVLPSEDTNVPTPITAAQEQPSTARSWPPLGALLLRDALVTDEDLEAALAQQRLAPSLRLGEILTGKGLVSRGTISRLVAEQYELPFYELERLEIDADVARRLPEEVAWRLKAVPIAEHEDGSLSVAVADPTSAVYSDDLRLALDVPLTFVVASPDDIEATLDRVHEYVQDIPDEEVDLAAEHGSSPMTSEDDVLSFSEPPHLVVEASASDVLDVPAEDDEPWTTRLELVEEIHADEAPEPQEPEVVELTWAPVAEIALPVEAPDSEEPSSWHPGEVVDLELPDESPETQVEEDAAAEAAIVDLEIPGESPETQVEDAAVPDAEVYELTWPVAPDDRDERSLEEDLVGQVAEALAPEVAETTVVEDDVVAPEPVGYDIFGIGSLALVENDTTAGTATPGEPLEQYLLLPEPTSALSLGPSEHVASHHPDAEEQPPALEYEAEAEIPEGVGLEELVLPETETEPEARVGPEPEPVWEHAAPERPDDEEEPPALEHEAEAHEDLAPEGAAPTDTETETETETELHADAETEFEPIPPKSTTEARSTDFDTAIEEAFVAGASAFHFSPRGDALTVRARVDGLVRDLGTATPEQRDAFVERLESEGLGRTHVVSTARGPKTTVFVRERAAAPTSLDELGFGADAAHALRSALEHPGGAILVCGPAGSGTTTTLYALLDALVTPERVVATVESPVDRMLDGVDQIEVDPSTGMTFASALRDLSLTDTDALLVDELAERESASLALGAAYEGRLVVAGFCAPGVAAAVRRLLDLGVEPAALASSLGCVVSQRLVRTVCADCHETYYASADELTALGQPETGSPRLLVRGTGCASCAGTGFRGRTALFEVLSVTEDVRGLIADGASAKKLQKAAVAGGMRTLREEGIRLCLEGVTTVAEVARVLGDDR